VMIAALIILASFVGMEIFTNVFHRVVMHKLLWVVHRTHHVRTSDGPFEWNDVFVLFFTTSAIGLIVAGLPDSGTVWIGTGVAAYGLTYFVVHDMVIHRRFLRLPKPTWRYLQAVHRAHMAHHRHVTNDHGEAYGLLWVPRTYWSSSSANRSPDA
jgi:beta-carotene 3-hydroxylase